MCMSSYPDAPPPPPPPPSAREPGQAAPEVPFDPDNPGDEDAPFGIASLRILPPRNVGL
jgi:hypothetical protein